MKERNADVLIKILFVNGKYGLAEPTVFDTVPALISYYGYTPPIKSNPYVTLCHPISRFSKVCCSVCVCVCVCVCVYYACMCAYTISTFVCGYVWCVCVCMCAYESYGMPFYLSFPDLKTLLPIITMVIVTNEQ